jgi:peptidoglycan/xylan/chitin deacetylase (PgdA/CDA1 family)
MSTQTVQVYTAGDTLWDKVRRRAVRLVARRPAQLKFARPTVSFTFDDVPATAALAGAEILERHGARGTFYISADLVDRDGHMGRFAGVEEIKTLHAAGHEIGCHTFSHLDCGRNGAALIEQDVERNTEALAEWGVKATTFAYPYGEVSLAAKQVLGPKYAALRTVRPGMVAGLCDLNHLPSVGIEGPGGEALARSWLDRAQAANGWLILFSHDVTGEPSPYGCKPCVLEALVREARERGFDILPLDEALQRGKTAA